MKTQFAKVQTLMTAVHNLSSKQLHAAIEEVIPQLLQEVNQLGLVVDKVHTELLENEANKFQLEQTNLQLVSDLRDLKLKSANLMAKERAKIVACKCAENVVVEELTTEILKEDEATPLVSEPVAEEVTNAK